MFRAPRAACAEISASPGACSPSGNGASNAALSHHSARGVGGSFTAGRALPCQKIARVPKNAFDGMKVRTTKGSAPRVRRMDRMDKRRRGKKSVQKVYTTRPFGKSSLASILLQSNRFKSGFAQGHPIASKSLVFCVAIVAPVRIAMAAIKPSISPGLPLPPRRASPANAAALA